MSVDLCREDLQRDVDQREGQKTDAWLADVRVCVLFFSKALL